MHGQSLNILTLISTHALQMVLRVFFYAIDEGHIIWFYSTPICFISFPIENKVDNEIEGYDSIDWMYSTFVMMITCSFIITVRIVSVEICC